MKGIVFPGDRKVELRDFPDPTPGPGEVVLEIKASGMCGSDLKFYRASGSAPSSLGLGGKGGPVIAGHEPCGADRTSYRHAFRPRRAALECEPASKGENACALSSSPVTARSNSSSSPIRRPGPARS